MAPRLNIYQATVVVANVLSVLVEVPHEVHKILMIDLIDVFVRFNSMGTTTRGACPLFNKIILFFSFLFLDHFLVALKCSVCPSDLNRVKR